MPSSYVSVHGRRLGIRDNGMLQVDGNLIGPNINSFGKTFYVDSVTGASGGTGLTPTDATATIQQAVTKCTANKGDIIVALPGHVETITAAAGIALSKAGISLIGLGRAGQRPTITYTTANTATMTVTAADVYIENILFVGNFLQIAGAINVTATGLIVDSCEFRDTDATHGFNCAILATGAANTADGLQVRNSKRIGLDTTGGAFVNITDNLARLTMTDNFAVSAGTSGAFLLSAGSKIVTAANIGRNKNQTAATSGNLFISNGGATNTGIVYDNYNANLDVTGAQTFGAATGMQFFNNQSTSTSTEAGALAQAADTPLS